MWRSTDSTTTMASSTTRPMASTNPNKESVLMVKPNNGKDQERAHQRNRDREQRNQRRSPALQKQVNHRDHQRESDQQRLDDFLHARGHGERGVDGNRRSPCRPETGSFASVIIFLTAAAVSTAFDPGNWYTAITALGFPFKCPTTL